MTAGIAYITGMNILKAIKSPKRAILLNLALSSLIDYFIWYISNSDETFGFYITIQVPSYISYSNGVPSVFYTKIYTNPISGLLILFPFVKHISISCECGKAIVYQLFWPPYPFLVFYIPSLPSKLKTIQEQVRILSFVVSYTILISGSVLGTLIAIIRYKRNKKQAKDYCKRRNHVRALLMIP